MDGFLKCFAYFSILSFGSFLFGRILPKKWFNCDKFPYHQFKFEKSGKLYKALKVRKWKGSAIDMSVILPMLIPSKRVPEKVHSSHVDMMIRETCIAEWTHYLLMVLGFVCVFIWENIGGWIMSLVFMFGNIPYVIIQRYNRPKLISLYRRLKRNDEQAAKGY